MYSTKFKEILEREISFISHLLLVLHVNVNLTLLPALNVHVNYARGGVLSAGLRGHKMIVMELPGLSPVPCLFCGDQVGEAYLLPRRGGHVPAGWHVQVLRGRGDHVFHGQAGHVLHG